MTLDGAIQHCLDVAKQCDSYKVEIEYKCGEEHRQLAQWLMELKDLRGAQNDQCAFFDELMDEYRKLKDIIRQIYKETLTDHYGDSLLALKNIDEILDKTGYLWKE